MGFHPSLSAGVRMYGLSDDDALTRDVQCPTLLLPAGNDPDNVKPGGSTLVELASKPFGADCESVPCTLLTCRASHRLTKWNHLSRALAPCFPFSSSPLSLHRPSLRYSFRTTPGCTLLFPCSRWLCGLRKPRPRYQVSRQVVHTVVAVPVCVAPVPAVPEMIHGWVPRGDLSNPTIARDVKAALELALAFYGKHL